VALVLNLIIVFLVSGLWHGANWTYVIWGGLHGRTWCSRWSSHRFSRCGRRLIGSGARPA
jgi:alginate O-acetyltransferase complex protein AlgI